MDVETGIRIGLQIIMLDIWLIWLVCIIADMFVSRKWFKQQDKDIKKQIELFNSFCEYQRASDEKYQKVLDRLDAKEKEDK